MCPFHLEISLKIDTNTNSVQIDPPNEPKKPSEKNNQKKMKTILDAIENDPLMKRLLADDEIQGNPIQNEKSIILYFHKMCLKLHVLEIRKTFNHQLI